MPDCGIGRYIRTMVTSPSPRDPRPSQENIMKSQQGFIILGGAAWLLAAALTGGYVGAVEHASQGKATVTVQAQEQQTAAIAAAPANPAYVENSVAYSGPLYRNGGYYGDKNSDVKLEGGM
jgi:hypothetical protein